MSEQKAASAGGAQYVAQIDGLRAIAVVAIVLFHASRSFLPSGFFGVDIFFVISGFVVTYSLLNTEHDGPKQFLRFFYSRRVLRIFPALIVTVIATALLSVIFIPRAYLSSQNIVTGIAALFASANVYLGFFSGGYFAPQAEFNPFTHTWSLGVEEQFYLIFPLLALHLKSDRRFAASVEKSKLIVAVLCGISLVICAWLTFTKPMQAFYMMPSRFWELGTGVLVAATLSRWRPILTSLKPRVTEAAAAAALLGVLASVVTPVMGEPTFPQALLPVVMTALLIMSVVAAPDTMVGRLLKTRPLRAIGLWSYSIYLVHWPIMVLLRWTVGLDSFPVQAISILLSFGLGYASYRYVEQPVRHLNFVKARKGFTVVGGGVAASVAAALLVGVFFLASNVLTWSTTGNRALWSPFSTEKLASTPCTVKISRLPSSSPSVVRTKESAEIQPTKCPGAFGGGMLYVIGDSHAAAYTRMVAQVVGETGRQGRIYSKGGCTLFNFRAANDQRGEACTRFSVAVTSELSANVKPGDILFMPGMRVDRLSEMFGAPLPVADQARSLAEAKSRAQAMAEAEAFIRLMRQRGVRVIIEAPLPVFRAPPFRCADWFNRSNPVCEPGFSVARAEQEAHRGEAMAAITHLRSIFPDVEVWDPMPLLCDAKTCEAFRDGKPLFFDGDHLSGHGDDLLASDFRRRLSVQKASL